MMEEMSLKEIRKYLDKGGAFVATTDTGMSLVMWHAGRGNYIIELTPSEGQGASTSARGLENIMPEMSRWAPLSEWTKEV
jgi:hypothetical protein